MATDDVDRSGPDAANEELRQMVRSLNDLDAEYAAGDLDIEDYHRLRSRYSVRVAEAARRLESPAGSTPDKQDSAAADSSASRGSGRSTMAVLFRRRRQVAVVVGLLALSVGAGWLLARSAGERGVNDALTGNIDESVRESVGRCHDLALLEEQLLASLQCFDSVLAENPHNAEALTYRAWYLVLATGAEDVVSPSQQETLLASASDYLDQAVLADPAYPDARTFRAVLADREGRSEDVCADIAALQELNPAPFFLEQTQPLAERNDC